MNRLVISSGQLIADVWKVRYRLGVVQNGCSLGSGSCSVTSRTAPAIFSCSNASTKADLSTAFPRPTLISTVCVWQGVEQVFIHDLVSILCSRENHDEVIQALGEPLDRRSVACGAVATLAPLPTASRRISIFAGWKYLSDSWICPAFPRTSPNDHPEVFGGPCQVRTDGADAQQTEPPPCSAKSPIRTGPNFSPAGPRKRSKIFFLCAQHVPEHILGHQLAENPPPGVGQDVVAALGGVTKGSTPA